MWGGVACSPWHCLEYSVLFDKCVSCACVCMILILLITFASGMRWILPTLPCLPLSLGLPGRYLTLRSAGGQWELTTQWYYLGWRGSQSLWEYIPPPSSVFFTQPQRRGFMCHSDICTQWSGATEPSRDPRGCWEETKQSQRTEVTQLFRKAARFKGSADTC